MDVNEYDRMVETGERPGVRVVGYIVLASLIPICGLLTLFTVMLFN